MASTVISARKLIKTALADYWRYKSRLIGTVALIAIPLSVLTIIGRVQDYNFPAYSSLHIRDYNSSAYSSFLSLIMNLALIWLVKELGSGRQPSLSQAYYRGTATIVRSLLLTVTFLLVLIPFFIGNLFYIQGVSGTTLAASGPEKLLLGLVWFVLSIPSIWLLSRYILSIYVLIERDLTPIGALRYAGKLVKGRTGKVLARLVALVFLVVIIGSLPALVILLTSLKGFSSAIALAILQLASILILLPITNLYLYGLYRALDHGEG